MCPNRETEAVSGANWGFRWMHMVIDEGRYYHSVSSRIGDEESVVVEASDGLIVPSFAGVYSCHQFFRRVHIVAFIRSGRGDWPFFHAWRRGRVSGVLRIGWVGVDAFEMGLVGVPSTGVGGGSARRTRRGFLFMVFSPQLLKRHEEIVRSSYQFSLLYWSCDHIKGCIGCILEGVSLPDVHGLREFRESGEACLGGAGRFDHFGDLPSFWEMSGKIEFDRSKGGRKVQGVTFIVSDVVYCHLE